MLQSYSAEQFYTNYYEELVKREAVHQLVIGNLKACMEQDRADVLFATICKENCTYFICHFPPYNLLVTTSNTQSKADDEYIVGEEIARYFKEHSINICGINASQTIALGFKDFYAKQGQPMKLDVAMDIMELREVNPFKQVGQLELASLENLEQLSLMYVNFTVEALGDAAQIELVRMRLRGYIEKQILYVLKVDDKIAAMCSTPRALAHGYSISAVYTLPQYRGKGLCKSLIGQLCTKLLQSGSQFLCLYVDKSNPFSNAAYEAVGFKVVGSTTSYEFVKE